jgi:uncharacterized protein (DUF1015 family)
MATLRPFRALRAASDRVARVASVPYDVVDTAEARDLAAGNADSFLHVVRPEIDLPPDADPHGDEVYAQGRRALDRLIAEGALVHEEAPALFLYQQVMDGRAQVGVMGLCSVDEYDADLIKKHEKTRPDKEDDRTRHVLELAAHAEPVFLAYRDTPAVDALVEQHLGTTPLHDFTAPYGIRHTVWRVDDPRPLETAFAGVPELYVADGHHRCAAASRARAARRAKKADQGAGGGAGAGDAADGFLAVCFPAGQLRILPYNRVVHDLNGETPRGFLDALGRVAEVREGGPTPSGRGHVAMYHAGAWHEVVAPAELLADTDPVASLDAAILQSLVLGPLLGIDDPRTSTRIDFVGGIRGSDELARRVDARGHGVAFALHPVSLEQLMAVADAGRVLPPKSTWFEPKLRSGLVVHELTPS